MLLFNEDCSSVDLFKWFVKFCHVAYEQYGPFLMLKLRLGLVIWGKFFPLLVTKRIIKLKCKIRNRHPTKPNP